MEKKEKKSFEMPHGFIVILLVLALCSILTWILPAGQFERVYDDNLGREIVVPDSYTEIEPNPAGPWEFFKAIYTGMTNASNIIFFIIFASGYVFVLMRGGALNAFVGSILRKLGNKDYLLIPIFMILFGIAGSTFGMYEETYGLIPAFIVIAITLGYDRLVGGSIVFVGVATGFASAVLNPFTIGIASDVAGIPLVSFKLTTFRIVCFILFETLSISYVMRYAKKIRKDPTKSILYGNEEENSLTSEALTRDEVLKLNFTTRQKLSLIVFVVLICLIAYTVVVYEFYLTELSAMFLIAMIVTGIINKMSSKEICDAFLESTSMSMYGALFIGLSRSCSVVLEQANVIDTAILYLSGAINALPNWFGSIGMLIVQNLIGFFITSGSGMAVVTMPIMAPLSDLIGMSREMAVTAYQFGDGFSNIFWPTVVATVCGIIGVGIDKWYKFITPLFLMMFLLQCVMMLVGGVIF